MATTGTTNDKWHWYTRNRRRVYYRKAEVHRCDCGGAAVCFRNGGWCCARCKQIEEMVWQWDFTTREQQKATARARRAAGDRYDEPERCSGLHWGEEK